MAQIRGSAGNQAAKTRRRAVTVADIIQMRKIANGDNEGNGPIAYFSPDHAKVIVVVKRGNLDNNTNEYSLLLWRTDQLFSEATPKHLLTIGSSSLRPAIKDVTWLSDSKTVLFLGHSQGDSQQLYSLDISSGVLTKLTTHPTNVLSYGATSDGKNIVYTAGKPTENIFDESAYKNGYIVKSQDSLYQLTIQKKGGEAATDDITADQHLYVIANGSPAHSILLPSPILTREITPYVSPDGSKVLIQTLWDGAEAWPTVVGNVFRRRFALIDLHSGEHRVPLNSPIGDEGSEAAWSDDGKSIIISDVFLPLYEPMDERERQLRRTTTFPVEINLADLRYDRIDHEGNNLRLMVWDWATDSVMFQERNNASTKPDFIYSKERGVWAKRSAEDIKEPVPQIVEEQNLNTPPQLFVIDPLSKVGAPLLDLNPEFGELKFSTVEALEWKTPNGNNVRGGLYYPIDYDAGKEYPLVIQTHGFTASKFMIDGPQPSAFAAQALAGRGMFVFQLDNDFTDAGSFKDIRRESAKFEDIVRHLAERKLINNRQVGIVGFSHTCAYVKYVLSHPRGISFAAASVQDGWDAGYFGYILVGVENGHNKLDESVYNGTNPFGRGLEIWRDRASNFNIEHVTAPVRIVAPNPVSYLGEWEWFSALSILGKPVEMVLMEEDSHELVKPWNRHISLEGNVEWFDFWLNGHEDPDPAKAEQYARWRGLRKLQERSENRPLPASP